MAKPAEKFTKAYSDQCANALAMLFDYAGIGRDGNLMSPLAIQNKLTAKGCVIAAHKADTEDKMSDVFVLKKYGKPVKGYMVVMKPTLSDNWSVCTYPLPEEFLGG